MKSFKIKVPALFILPVFMLALLGCDADDRIDLAEDPEERQEVYQQILSDEQLFTEFIDEMRQNDRSMEWMRASRPMMRNMYGRQHMQQVMANHPEVIDTMMMQGMMMMQTDTTMFRRNPEMRRRMMQNMMLMMQRDTSMYRQMQDSMRNMQR